VASERSVVNCRVVDAAGAPIEGASVYIVASPVAVPDIAQHTDADGRCAVTVPGPGRYRFGVRTSNDAAERELEVAGRVVPLDVSMQR
jgi:hypothetical protein